MVDSIIPEHTSGSSCYPTTSAPETGPAPGPFTCQVTSRFLIRPGKISRTNWSENKASFIQVEKKKEVGTSATVEKKRKVGPGGCRPACEGVVPALTLKLIPSTS